MKTHINSGMVAERLTLPVSEERDHIQGKKTAPMTLLEYGDYECPACGYAYPIVKALQATLGDHMRFAFRNFPITSIHPHAELAAEAAETAGIHKRFWEMHDTLYEHQDALDAPYLVQYAQALGIDPTKFIKELESGITRPRVKEDMASGIRSGVNGTPTFFINGLRYDGPHDFDSLVEALT